MNKVKWGIIGAGGIADRRTIPGLIQAENAELVSVMEVNLDLLTEFTYFLNFFILSIYRFETNEHCLKHSYIKG